MSHRTDLLPESTQKLLRELQEVRDDVMEQIRVIEAQRHGDPAETIRRLPSYEKYFAGMMRAVEIIQDTCACPLTIDAIRQDIIDFPGQIVIPPPRMRLSLTGPW